jgi:hypothetical protein
MSRFLKQGKAAFSSPTTLKETLQPTSGNGEVRYNKDLLPSPPCKIQAYAYTTRTDISQRIEGGDGNIISPTI